MPRSRNKEDAAPSEDYEVRKTIAQQLQEYHSEKATKQRRKKELEEKIRLGDRVDYGDSGDDDDHDELTITRCESMRSQVEWEERQRRRVRIGQDSVFEMEGGSNSGTQGIRRSFTVRNSERSGREHQWTNLDSPRARLANMDPVLER
ncbi:hypothetical protein PVK06_047397 [Gossypium arboreum]|uniref:Uncharacterized protein n=1 Tax=Gossypium arboreum TaxID=29729 RepID=A0ABR0MF35_GOSAR|nr:hypothetical protein PVK06_047397 [Gossypium arboreum]